MKLFASAAAAASASVFFGSSVVATRYIVHDIDPILLAFLRYLIATVCLGPVVFLTVQFRPDRGDLIRIAGLGLVFFGLFPWFFSAGLQYIPSARGALWLATMPFLTFGLAALLGYETVTLPKLAGIILATSGVAAALSGADVGAVAGAAWWGDLLLFATSCCGAVYFVLSRPVLRRVPSLLVTWLSMVSGTVFLGVLSTATGTIGIPDLSPSGWLALAFLGTFGAALGFFLWIWALQRSTPTRTAIFLTLNPMAATLLGVVLLGEPITAAFLIGLGLVLTGIIVANVQAPAAKLPATT